MATGREVRDFGRIGRDILLPAGRPFYEEPLLYELRHRLKCAQSVAAPLLAGVA